MKYYYPAVFMPGDDCYELNVVDVEGCLTGARRYLRHARRHSRKRFSKAAQIARR